MHYEQIVEKGENKKILKKEQNKKILGDQYVWEQYNKNTMEHQVLLLKKLYMYLQDPWLQKLRINKIINILCTYQLKINLYKD